jgi:hypothetical protein
MGTLQPADELAVWPRSPSLKRLRRSVWFETERITPVLIELLVGRGSAPLPNLGALGLEAPLSPAGEHHRGIARPGRGGRRAAVPRGFESDATRGLRERLGDGVVESSKHVLFMRWELDAGGDGIVSSRLSSADVALPLGRITLAAYDEWARSLRSQPSLLQLTWALQKQDLPFSAGFRVALGKEAVVRGRVRPESQQEWVILVAVARDHGFTMSGEAWVESWRDVRRRHLPWLPGHESVGIALRPYGGMHSIWRTLHVAAPGPTALAPAIARL